MGQTSTPEYSGYALDIITERGYTCIENLTLSELSAACWNAVQTRSRLGCRWPQVGTPFPWRTSLIMSPTSPVLTLNLVARTHTGKRLDAVRLLVSYARRWEADRDRRWRTRWLKDWNGEGPVPGTGKRGSYSRHYKKPKTQAERRWAVWEVEDGEPAIRAARQAHYLPTRWDDCYRRVERSWKSQHKGRKAWDRG